MCNSRERQLPTEADRQTFHELYLKHHREVYGISLRMTQDVSESEDLTQDVFLHLFRTIGSFRGESAFSTWLHRLTVNIVLMHFRKRRRKSERTTKSGNLPVQVAEGSHHPERMQIVDRILEMKGRLDGTSKSQLHKGRAMLRALITQSRPNRYVRKQSVPSIA